MLSGETAIGAYPVLAAEAAMRIAGAAEAGEPDQSPAAPTRSTRPADALAVAAVALAVSDPEVTVLVAAGREPRIALAASSHRPHVPIIAVVPDRRIARRLQLVRGVWPVVPADARLARDPGAATGDELLADPAVRAAVPATGRAVVVAGSHEGTIERIEAVHIPPAAAG
jgi:pyruvate kinase